MNYSSLNIDSVIFFIIAWGGIQSILMAFTQILYSKRRVENILLAILLTCMGIFQFQFVLLYGFVDIGKQYPLLFCTHMAPIYLAGPLYYLYVQNMVTPHYRYKYRQALHYLPSLVIFIFEISIQFLHLQNRDEILNKILRVSFLDEPGVFTLLKTLALLHLLAYIIIMIVKIMRFWLLKKKSPIIRHTLRYNFISAFCLSIFIASYLSGNITAIKWSFLTVPLLIMILYAMVHRSPEFLTLFKNEVEKIRYERSMLRGFDVNELNGKLISLMSEEKIFCDEDISLARIAGELSITPHQLSELLNSKHNINFYSFINGYRIEEAKKIMRDEPDRSILSVAYAVGFNSKASFYSAFLKFAGTTPHKYRRSLSGLQL
jgi:AraC-like DNA-binding protein